MPCMQEDLGSMPRTAGKKKAAKCCGSYSILALRRLKQGDRHEFRAISSYIVKPCLKK